MQLFKTGSVGRIVSTLLLGGVALGFAACGADDSPQNATGHAIGFGMNKVSGRAETTVTAGLKKIGVFGYSHEGAYATTASTLFPNYFLNQSVIKPTGSAVWSYPGTPRYWPLNEDTKLSFFAYAPFVDVEDTFTLLPSAVSQTVTPTIAYTVPSDIYKQVDLLWSNAFDQVYSTNSGVVEFEMDHALARLDFLVKLNDAEKGRPYVMQISEITVKNVVGAGTLDLAKAKGDADLWDVTYPDADADWSSYTLTPSTGLASLTLDARNETPAPGETDPYNFTKIIAADHCLMLIPQSIEDLNNGTTPAQVVVKYSFTNVYSGETIDKEETIALATPALRAWSAGQGINYRLTLSLVEGAVVEFDVEGFIAGTPWVDGNGGTIIGGDIN